jgi:hypothetical protein
MERGSGGITLGKFFEMLHARRCILAHFGGETEHQIFLILWPEFLLERWKAAYFSDTKICDARKLWISQLALCLPKVDWSNLDRKLAGVRGYNPRENFSTATCS